MNEKKFVNINGANIKVKEYNNERILHTQDLKSIGFPMNNIVRNEFYRTITRNDYGQRSRVIIRKSDFIILIDELKLRKHKKVLHRIQSKDEYLEVLKQEVLTKYYNSSIQPTLISSTKDDTNDTNITDTNIIQDTQLEISSPCIQSITKQILESNPKSKELTLEDKISLFKTLLNLTDILLDKCNGNDNMKINTYNNLLKELELPIRLINQ